MLEKWMGTSPLVRLASVDERVLLVNLERAIVTCERQCAWHRRLVLNAMRIAAQRSLSLSTRMMHITPKTIQGRLLSYLSRMALEHGSVRFSIPLPRQQLADYLGVDRSALSAELSKMRRDGLIDCRRNEFTLHALKRFPGCDAP